jgi:hypothetical protein
MNAKNTLGMRSQRRRRGRQREGAVMLVVLLIVLTATTLAATSLQSTQFELRNSGYNRAALQTQYVSEAAAMASLAWIDATSLDRSFMEHVNKWSETTPDMTLFGEPNILTSNPASANRMQWIYQEPLTNVTIPPITYPGYSKGTFEDKYGSLGPRSTYVAGNQMDDNVVSTNYVVDMYDCRRLSNTASAGYQVNQGGSGTMQYFQMYCVLTSRGRTYVPYGSGTAKKPTKTWQVTGGGTNVAYVVNRFTMAHDSRGSIITPPMIQ